MFNLCMISVSHSCCESVCIGRRRLPVCLRLSKSGHSFQRLRKIRRRNVYFHSLDSLKLGRAGYDNPRLGGSILPLFPMCSPLAPWSPAEFSGSRFAGRPDV